MNKLTIPREKSPRRHNLRPKSAVAMGSSDHDDAGEEESNQSWGGLKRRSLGGERRRSGGYVETGFLEGKTGLTGGRVGMNSMGRGVSGVVTHQVLFGIVALLCCWLLLAYLMDMEEGVRQGAEIQNDRSPGGAAGEYGWKQRYGKVRSVQSCLHLNMTDKLIHQEVRLKDARNAAAKLRANGASSPEKSQKSDRELEDEMDVYDLDHQFFKSSFCKKLNGEQFCGEELVKEILFPKRLNASLYREQTLKLLYKWDEFCETHSLQYALDSGSLIGSYRHGMLLPWDDDSDIIIPASTSHRLLSLKKELYAFGYGLVNQERYWKVFPLDGIDIGEKYEWKWPFVDLFVYEVYGKKVKLMYNAGKDMELELNWLNPIRRSGSISREPGEKGRLLNVPNLPSTYLDRIAWGWQQGAFGPRYNHINETKNDNGGDLTIPMKMIQKYIPILCGKVSFSVSTHSWQEGSINKKDKSPDLCFDSYFEGKADQFTGHSFVKQIKELPKLNFKQGEKLQLGDTKVIAQNRRVPSSVLSKSSKGKESKVTIIDLCASVITHFLGKMLYDVKGIMPGSGHVDYYAFRGHLCEKRTTYGALVSVSIRTESAEEEERAAWCDMVTTSGFCNGYNDDNTLYVESLTCRIDESVIVH
eukprot:Nk52_evm15s227 gene=Nk52_evmTU15s227